MSYENVEMTSKHMKTDCPSCFLYCSGSAIYFDEEGNQITELQMIGLRALKEFVRRFPNGKVYWGIWRGTNQEMNQECILGLLEHLKHPYE